MVKEAHVEDWHHWFREWGDRLLLFARQQTGSFAEAEDIVQEAFVHVWSRRDIYPRIEPGLFFLQIRRMAIDHGRRERRRQQREEAYAGNLEPAHFMEPAGTGPDRQLVEQCLQALPQEQREVLLLKIWGEQTFDAIGQLLDISPNTAASRYRYGLDALRRHLEGAGK